MPSLNQLTYTPYQNPVFKKIKSLLKKTYTL